MTALIKKLEDTKIINKKNRDDALFFIFMTGATGVLAQLVLTNLAT